MVNRVDARTKTMSHEAKTCRSWGHSSVPLPTPAKLRMEYRQKGQRYKKLVCSRGCSYWRLYILDRATGDVISSTSGYTNPAEYLVQTKGTGRLPKAAARAAWFREEGD
jgi:hypothetical protein